VQKELWKTDETESTPTTTTTESRCPSGGSANPAITNGINTTQRKEETRYPTQIDLMSSAADTRDHASHSVTPGSERARQMTVISGRKCIDLLKLSGRDGSLPRTLLGTSAWGSTMCWLTWKDRVTPAGRLLFQLVPSMPDTAEIESGLWPTMTVADHSGHAQTADNKTPGQTGGTTLPGAAGGQLNPQFVEWLMGFPSGWTDLKPSETP